MITRKKRFRSLCLILAIGLTLCVWQLGSTGLMDETPPLFAAAARSMSDTGDWLTPRVNGLPRYDKPPLIYWLMGALYSLPGQASWDPLGTWSARLPSALSSLGMMLLLGETVMSWPQKSDNFPRRTGVSVALVFALSPLVMIWSRIAVSDALLCSTLGASFLLQWRRYASPNSQPWWLAWLFLGLAVLTKGPVAIVLMGLTLLLFSFIQWDFWELCTRLRPLPGLLITFAISFPWYLSELLVEGQPFWDSFFGYHNFQRFTSVVNSHFEPWWFFLPVMALASLPFTPLLITELFRVLLPLGNGPKSSRKKPENSLGNYSLCWLLSVFFLFTFAATKLPSYWMPATPAAALLIGLCSISSPEKREYFVFGWVGSVLLACLISLGLWISPLWLPEVYDPEMPSLSRDLMDSGILITGAFCLSLSALFGLWGVWRRRPETLFVMQLPLIAFHLFGFLPFWNLADRVRQVPLRQVAQLLLDYQMPSEPIAMVGVMKPSMHFYTNQVVVFEGPSSGALINLSERLREEHRQGWKGRPIQGVKGSSTVLVVIDQATTNRLHWQDLKPQILGEFGIYGVWRVDRGLLEKRAEKIQSEGVKPDWRKIRPEKY